MDDDFKAMVRQIIREELAGFMGSSQYQFQKDAKFYDARNIQVGSTTGTMIGTSADQRIGFYGATPIWQNVTPTYPSGGATIDDQARASINQLINTLSGSAGGLGLVA